MSKTISPVASSLAALILKRSLEKGNEIKIPSLSIKFSLKDGVREIEMGSVLPTVEETEIPQKQAKDNRKSQ